YMGQVVGGLSGEDSGLSLPKLTGADALARFKSTSALYVQLSEKVRTAISSADRLKLARQAATSLVTAGDQIYSQFDSRVGVPAAGASGILSRRELAVALLVVGVLFVL